MNIILLDFMIQFFLSLLLLHGWLRPGASNDISPEIKDQRTHLILAYKWIINIQQYSMRKTFQSIALIFKMKNRIRMTIMDTVGNCNSNVLIEMLLPYKNLR